MTNSRSTLTTIIYPESDGQPMTESDATRDYLLLSSQEEVIEERDDALQALDNEKQRAAALAEKLRSLGIDPDEI